MSAIAALFLVVLMAAMALALQASDLYVIKLRSQRVADLANLAAASTSSAIVSGAVSATATATATNIATINGFGSSTVSVTATGTTSSTLKTTIATTADLLLGYSFNGSTTSNVAAEASSSIATTTGGSCLAALTGYVTIHTYANVQMPNCGVTANTYLQVLTATLNAKDVTVGYSQLLESGFVAFATSLAPVLSSFTFSSSVTDSIASKTDITALSSKLTSMSSWPYATSSALTPSYPTVSTGTNQTYTSTTATLNQATRYGTVTVTNSTLTFSGNGAADPNCTNPTTIKGNLTLSGTNTLTFNSGCYVFGADIAYGSDNTTTFALASNAVVRFIIIGSIKNNASGTLIFPDATYSIGYGVLNYNGGRIQLGNGSKTINNQIYNNWGYVVFGNGPLYMTYTTISQYTGTMTFGSGPFYFYTGAIYNYAAGTMTFGQGPFYLYNVNIQSGDGTAYPLMTFAGGPYYLYNSSIYTYNNAATYFGPGDMDLYWGSMVLNGANTIFGWGGSTSTGSSTISFYNGSFYHYNGNLTANGVTFAMTYGTIHLGGDYVNISAPTGSGPSYGKQNVLFYSKTGAINVAMPNGSGQMSGLMYAPGGTISAYYDQTVTYPSSGCLAAVGANIAISSWAKISLKNCTGYEIGTTSTTSPVLQ